MPPNPTMTPTPTALHDAACACHRRAIGARSAATIPTGDDVPTWEWRELEGRSVKFDLKKHAECARNDFPFFTQVRHSRMLYFCLFCNSKKKLRTRMMPLLKMENSSPSLSLVFPLATHPPQSEIEAECARGRLLIVIDNGVYDLTTFAARHPGGALALQHAAGQQVSDLFAEYHPSSTYAMLPSLQYGVLALSCRPRVSELARDRRELRQQLLREGLFESRPWYFVGVVVRALCFLAASVTLLLTATRAEWASYATAFRFVAAVCLGLFFQQMAFVGHDSGHSGVSHIRYTDSVIGLFTGNFFSGISMAWWKVRALAQ